MLLPSAISCDAPSSSSQPSHQRAALEPSLFASPPASPPTSLLDPNGGGGFSNIMSACRSLHSLLSGPAPAALAPSAATAFHHPGAGPTGLGITQDAAQDPTTALRQLPTPPLAHAPSPMKLRLRPRRNNPQPVDGAEPTPSIQRRRIVKRATRSTGASTAGTKRRRIPSEDPSTTRDNSDVESDLEIPHPLLGAAAAATIPASEPARASDPPAGPPATEPSRPHTPKRARIAPEVLPLGLDRSDYHHLHALQASRGELDPDPSSSSSSSRAGTDVELGPDGARWSAEDDRILVELVLEKLRLSKAEWSECARSLGKDRGSVGKRWKSLVLSGEVGLKTRGGGRRGKICGTWR